MTAKSTPLRIFSQNCVIGGISEDIEITSALIEIQDDKIIDIHPSTRGKAPRTL